MSTQILTIIPVDPFFTPSAEAAAKAAAILRGALAVQDDEGGACVEYSISDSPNFVSSMESFEAVHCPRCDSELDVAWWQGKMDADFDGEGFSSFSTLRLPCCGAEANLNELCYEAPQGFARFAISCQEPPAVELSAEQIAEIEKVVGCRLRQILAHV